METLTDGEIYVLLVEHLLDRFEPDEAVNRATRIFAKYYLNAEAWEPLFLCRLLSTQNI